MATPAPGAEDVGWGGPRGVTSLGVGAARGPEVRQGPQPSRGGVPGLGGGGHVRRVCGSAGAERWG